MNTNRTLWLLLLLSSMLTGGTLGASAPQLTQTARSSVEVDGNPLMSQNRGSSDATCVPGSGRRGCAVPSTTLDV